MVGAILKSLSLSVSEFSNSVVIIGRSTSRPLVNGLMPLVLLSLKRSGSLSNSRPLLLVGGLLFSGRDVTSGELALAAFCASVAAATNFFGSAIFLVAILPRSRGFSSIGFFFSTED